MTLDSKSIQLCDVRLPYAGRQFYMHPVNISSPDVPEGFDDYLPIVKKLLAKTGVTDGIAYLTVDEKIVRAGQTQRRPGPHVDGCFMPDAGIWGHDEPSGQWNHYCNHLPIDRMPVIVAASVAGCRVYEGEFDAIPRNDGDLSHVALPEGALVPANVAMWLSPDCVHESLPFAQDTQRSFMRLAMPVGSFPS